MSMEAGDELRTRGTRTPDESATERDKLREKNRDLERRTTLLEERERDYAAREKQLAAKEELVNQSECKQITIGIAGLFAVGAVFLVSIVGGVILISEYIDPNALHRRA